MKRWDDFLGKAKADARSRGQECPQGSGGVRNEGSVRRVHLRYGDNVMLNHGQVRFGDKTRPQVVINEGHVMSNSPELYPPPEGDWLGIGELSALSQVPFVGGGGEAESKPEIADLEEPELTEARGCVEPSNYIPCLYRTDSADVGRRPLGASIDGNEHSTPAVEEQLDLESGRREVLRWLVAEDDSVESEECCVETQVGLIVGLAWAYRDLNT